MLGVDINQKTVDTINAGQCPIEENGLPELVAAAGNLVLLESDDSGRRHRAGGALDRDAPPRPNRVAPRLRGGRVADVLVRTARTASCARAGDRGGRILARELPLSTPVSAFGGRTLPRGDANTSPASPT